MSLLAPGPHGGDGARLAAALGVEVTSIVDLSQSLNPVAVDPAGIVAKHLGALGRYPDSKAATEALAGAMGRDPDQLLLTNGGAEAIALVTAELGGSVREPEFSLHPRGGGPRWRSNPSSPLGRLAGADERAAVWDEAFYPMATGQWTRGDEGSVVVGSLTKLLSCPGLRVGYVLASSEFVAAVRRRQTTWTVNALVAESLADLLATVDLAGTSRAVAVLRGELAKVLVRHGLAPWPSDANWLLVEATGLRDALARHGVLVRDCATFGLAGVVRLAVTTPAQLERLDDALTRAAGEFSSSRERRAGVQNDTERGVDHE